MTKGGRGVVRRLSPALATTRGRAPNQLSEGADSPLRRRDFMLASQSRRKMSLLQGVGRFLLALEAVADGQTPSSVGQFDDRPTPPAIRTHHGER
jgi:hypothetical protein